jgi:antitoxin ParD1/3/4
MRGALTPIGRRDSLNELQRSKERAMTVEIPAEFSQFVEQVISRGSFASETEVIGAGLRLLQERERKLEALRAEILPALESLDRGEGKPLDIEDVIARGQQRLAERNRKG